MNSNPYYFDGTIESESSEPKAIGWYFWAEDFAEYGPYETRLQARIALQSYCLSELGVEYSLDDYPEL